MERAHLLEVSMLSVPLLLLTTAAAATPPPSKPIGTPGGQGEEVQLPVLLKDLQEGDHAEKRFAARELRRQARLALRGQGSSSPVRAVESRQLLSDFDHSVAPLCIEQLDDPWTRRHCADILGMLETESALPSLEQRLIVEDSRRTRRHLQRAIDRIHDGGAL